MTEDDRPGFSELMVSLGEAFTHAVSDPLMEMYFRALKDFSIDEIRAAAQVHVMTQKFFPRVAELREATVGSMDDRAEIAWRHVHSEVRRCGWMGELPGRDGQPLNPPKFPDEATRRAAMELYGGWQSLCFRLPGSGPELLGMAKHFKACYAAIVRGEYRQAAIEQTKREAHESLLDLGDELHKRRLPAPGLPSRARISLARSRGSGTKAQEDEP